MQKLLLIHHEYPISPSFHGRSKEPERLGISQTSLGNKRNSLPPPGKCGFSQMELIVESYIKVKKKILGVKSI